MSEQTPQTFSAAALAGLACRCPRCHKGKLFEGFLTLRQRCDVGPGEIGAATRRVGLA